MTLANVTDHTIGLQVERNSSESRTLTPWRFHQSRNLETNNRSIIHCSCDSASTDDVDLRIVFRIQRGRQ